MEIPAGWRARSLRPLLLLCIGVLVAMGAPPQYAVAVQSPGSAATLEASPRLQDWPLDGLTIGYSYLQWRVEATAAEHQRTAPLSPSTVLWLSRAHRVDETLATLRRIIDERPDLMTAAFDHYQADVGRSRATDRRPAAREVVRAARARLATLPREEQAALDAALQILEWQATDPPIDSTKRLGQFVQQYAGTRAAALVSVNVAMHGRLSMERLAALDALAANHPRTEIAAKALYEKAFQLSHNSRLLGVTARESDPTDVLLEVIRIVTDLESGAYPPCRWVNDAPKLVSASLFLDARVSPQNVDRALAAITGFARAHMRLAEDPATSDDFIYTVLWLVSAVTASEPDGSIAADRTLAALEADVPDRAAVRFARAQRWLRPANGPLDPAARTAGRRALEETSEMTSSRFARKALASLAEIDFREGRFMQARIRFSSFVRQYPASDFAWMAALRVGQAEQALGRHQQAADAFAEAAQQFAAVPFARVLGSVYAARSLETVGAVDKAHALYRDARSAWTADLGDELHTETSFSPEGFARMVDDPATVTRDELTRRVDQLSASLAQPGGRELEQGRWLVLSGRQSDAQPVLERVAREFPSTAAAAEAGTLLHHARLAAALAGASGPDTAAALTALEALSREPFDSAVGMAGIAAATLRLLQGDTQAADAAMHAALKRWIAEGAPARIRPAAGMLEADVLAIRDTVFQPLGGGVFAQHWNAQEWPSTLPAYLVAPSELRVEAAGADDPLRVSVAWRPAGLPNVLLLTPDAAAALARLVPRLGGTATGEPQSVMATPNQPIGDARSIVEWWNRFFPARPGHWSGFEVLTYPSFSTIEFTNAERTRAIVPVTVGYSGGTVVLEKVNGAWVIRDLVDQWIT